MTLRQTDALIHVIDASGTTDEDGKIKSSVTQDLYNDVEFGRQDVVLQIKGSSRRIGPGVLELQNLGQAQDYLQFLLVEKLCGLWTVSYGKFS